jgi:hypothetical protein
VTGVVRWHVANDRIVRIDSFTGDTDALAAIHQIAAATNRDVLIGAPGKALRAALAERGLGRPHWRKVPRGPIQISPHEASTLQPADEQ